MDPAKLRQAMLSMYGGLDAISGGDPHGTNDAGPDGRVSPHHAEQRGPFVDRIEPAKGGEMGDVAVLLMPDGTTQEVPLRALPKGTHEGAYLGPGGADDLRDQGNEAEEVRKRLSRDDDGKDFGL